MKSKMNDRGVGWAIIAIVLLVVLFVVVVALGVSGVINFAINLDILSSIITYAWVMIIGIVLIVAIAFLVLIMRR